MGLNPGFGSPLPRGLNILGGGWRGQGVHAGADMAVAQGTPVFAIGDGFVTRASATPSGDLGIFAAITHPSGIVSRYLHFSQLLVAPGQTVRKGQQIGFTGNTGNSAAPHLHLDLKVPGADVLEAVKRAVGTPKTGFEANVTGFGAGIPAESWVPFDSIVPSVLAEAAANGIPIYKPGIFGSGIVGTLAKIALVAGLGYAAYELATRPGSETT